MITWIKTPRAGRDDLTCGVSPWKVLALIHRNLPRLDKPGRASEVQAAFRKAAALIESARRRGCLPE